VRQALNEDPLNLGEYSYTNAGYVVASHIAERATKRTWEELMCNLVFKPLGLHSAGFGWPAAEDHPDEPHGHFGAQPYMSVQEIGDDATGDLDYFGPAGHIHCSIEDFARFAAFHLAGLRGQDGVMKAQTIERLHTPPANGDYAGGWWIRETKEGEFYHEHTGSGGTFYTWITLYPESDLGIVIATNCGFHAKPFLKSMRDAIYSRLRRDGQATPEDD
jgi:CubicO group peptidase (beta-lactamase class C family)